MKILFTFISLFLINFSILAQLDSLVVEKYYISDANDAKFEQYRYNDNGDIVDTVYLGEGSTTYRIYLALHPESKLLKVFGDVNHTFKISSDNYFFNDIENGVGIGTEIRASNLKYNLLSLDSWLTLGYASKTKKGIFKSLDQDGSVLAGTSNQYLKNADPKSGNSLYLNDGLIESPSSSLQCTGLDIYGNDSTIFGSLLDNKAFSSNALDVFSFEGITGTGPHNMVLVSQVTTKGNLVFELNIEVLISGNQRIKYVAKKAPSDDTEGIVYSSYLSYPPSCGCTDPNYLEYRNTTCSISDSCKTLAVAGCMDPNACNYDPNANISVPSLCCYPGKCANRDISLVCPDLGLKSKSLLIYPNPAEDLVTISMESEISGESLISFYNCYGKLLKCLKIQSFDNKISKQIDVSDFGPGIYYVKLTCGENHYSEMFIKKAL